jgi:hypothetical protein
MPPATAWRASPGQVQRASGFPAASGQLPGQGLHFGHDPGGERAGPAGPRGVGQPGQAALAGAAAPPASGVLADAQPDGDRAARQAACRQQDNPRPQHHAERRGSAPGHCFQLRLAGVVQADGIRTGGSGAPPR